MNEEEEEDDEEGEEEGTVLLNISANQWCVTLAFLASHKKQKKSSSPFPN